MYNNQDQYWFNQTLLFHHDRTEGTDAKLSLTATASSSDLITLGQPFLSLRISNHLSKSCLLKIQDVVDLHASVEVVFKYQKATEIFKNENNNTILKKYNKNNNLILDFKTNTNGIPVVKISLRSSDTDFATVVIRWEMFKGFMAVVTNYKDQYANYINVLNQQMIAKKLSKLEQIDNSIKGLYSLFDGKEPEFANQPDESINKENVSWSSDMTDEFDKFVKEEDIELPEIEKDIDKAEKDVKSKPVEKVDSPLFNLLGNDLSKFESYVLNKNNIIEFKDELQKELEFELLPHEDEDEFKSLVYLSTYYYQLTLQSHTNRGEPIPSGFPLMKYHPSKFDNRNLDLAYDLLTIQVYFKIFRARMENKTEDSIQNYSRFHLALRMFTDSMIYGFIHDISNDSIKSIILNRYKYLAEENAFRTYDKKLDDYICPEIKEKDVSYCLDELIPNAKKFEFIKELHEGNKDTLSLRLGVKNSFTLEQIIKEVIPLEVNEQLGVENDFNEIDPEISKIFETKKKEQSKTKAVDKTNVVQLFLKKFKTEMNDDELYDKLFNYLKSYEKFSLDFSDFPFEIDNLPENILKGLYIWNPTRHKTYTKLKNDLDTAPEKSLIITKIKDTREASNTMDGVNWNFT